MSENDIAKCRMIYINNLMFHEEILKNYILKENNFQMKNIFNQDNDSVSENEINDYKKGISDSAYNFLIVVKNNADIKKIIRNFMETLKKITDSEFTWLASIHEQGNIHVHILINGIDLNSGNKIKITHELLRKNGF